MINKILPLLVLLNLFSACTRDSERPISVVNIPLSSEVSTLDPANSYDTISATVVYQSLEQLFEYHYLKRPYSLKPLLAVDMPEVSDDSLTYTIRIKENIRYHDHPVFGGKPRFLKAQDFIDQIKRLAFYGTQSNGWWLFDGKIIGLNEFREAAGTDLEQLFKHEVKGLKAIDDHTLQIKLTEPYPQLLNVLAMSFASPVPRELIKFYENILDDVLIGTGPYKLDEWNRGEKIIMRKFEHYHPMHYPSEGDRLANSRGFLEDAGKQIPFVDQINFRILKENHIRWQEFIKGNVDFIAIPKDQHATAIDHRGRLSAELQRKNLQLQVVPSLTYWWLSFNMNDPIVGKNYYLRKAMAHALDVNRYIEVFTSNIGQKANSIYPPGIFGYNPASRPPYEYNLERARYYLEKAGYPNGEGLPPITYHVRGSSSTNQKQADYIAREMAKIGIEVIPATIAFPSFLQLARSGELQFWLDGWALDYPDAENVLQLLVTRNHSPGPNATFYSNPEFDQLFDKLRFLPDGDEKEAKMQKLEEIVHSDLPWIMLYYSRDYLLQHAHLKNYRHSDIIYNYVKYLKLDR